MYQNHGYGCWGRTGFTICIVHLYTRCGTFKCTGYAGCDALLYFLIVNHRDRTGQRFFLAVPYATTTTSSKASALLLIVTFTLGLIATSCVCIPIYEITRVFAELGTFGNVKSPSTPVIAPICVPFTNTEAPITGCPSSSEITTPVTFWVWAVTRPIPTKDRPITALIFFS